MSIVVVSNTDPNPEIKESPTPEVKNKDQNVDQKNQSAPEGKDPSEQKDAVDSGTTKNKDEAEKKNKDASEIDESDDSDSEDKEESEKDEKPKKKGGFQRRIDKLNARVAEERQQREALEQRLAQIERAGEKDSSNKKSESDGKPNPENFETHAEYVEALTDWKIEQREKTAKETASKSELESQQKKLFESHSKRVQAFAEKTQDFHDVLEDVDDVPLSPTVTEILVTSENGPELMYELAKNRTEYERINKLPPLAAARELGKIESKLAAKSKETQEPKTITKAPKPIDPVGGKGGNVQKSIYDESISQREYEELRAKQRRA